MKEDISHLVSSMLYSNIASDLSRMLTKENIFDGAVMRAFLMDSCEDDSDMEDFFADMAIDESFLRGFMAGLVQCILIDRSRGETMGKPSHADILSLYDATSAYLLESRV